MRTTAIVLGVVGGLINASLSIGIFVGFALKRLTLDLEATALSGISPLWFLALFSLTGIIATVGAILTIKDAKLGGVFMLCGAVGGIALYFSTYTFYGGWGEGTIYLVGFGDCLVVPAGIMALRIKSR